MQKTLKIINIFAVCILLNICMVFTNGMKVKADQLAPLNSMQVLDVTDIAPRGTYLGTGSATLTNKGNHVVNVSGYTNCNRTSDQVKVTLHLQRLKNGVWENVSTLGPKVAYNTNYVSNSKNYTVTGGYYYRISGSHTAIKGSVVETTSSETDGLWIAK